MLDKKSLFWGDCTDKLALAKTLHAALNPDLADNRLAQDIRELAGLARDLAEHMTAMNLGLICTACAARPGGGCCSRVMADETDALQLLMNLLAGIPVAVCRDNGCDCLLLGEQGCTLLFKPIFCLNYDCVAIKTGCAPQDLARYETRRGRLLQAQWRLEQELLARLEELTLPIP